MWGLKGGEERRGEERRGEERRGEESQRPSGLFLSALITRGYKLGQKNTQSRGVKISKQR